MSVNVILFRSLLQFVLKPGMRFHDLRIAATFCWAVTGLLLSGKISMSHCSVHRRSRANAASDRDLCTGTGDHCEGWRA